MLTLDANIWTAAFDPSDRFHAQSTAFLLSRRAGAVTPADWLVSNP